MSTPSPPSLLTGFGFTLVELLAVLALLAIFLAGTVAVWRPTIAMTMVSSQKLVAQLVTEARTLAHTSQSTVRLVAGSGPGAGADAAGRGRWLRIFRADEMTPPTWLPVGPDHHLPRQIQIVPPSGRALSSPDTTLSAGPDSALYAEFQPDGNFQPRSADGTGVIVLAPPQRDAGGTVHTVRWQVNGSVTIAKETAGHE